MGQWLQVCGKQSAELEQSLTDRVTQRIAAGAFRADDVNYISKLTIGKNDPTGAISEERLEKIRRLCQLWELDIKAVKIESHRKFIGPIIVGVKRLILPLLRVLLKDTIRQQRDFNAAVISLLTDLSRKDRPER